MKQKLTFMEILPIGLMLFASFFGAGNLIFPPALGQSAGVNFLPAAAGFCTTGVGIPLLGIIAIGLLRASNPEALALPVHPKFAKALIVVTVLTIGPFFAIPRTGAVSFDVGILPFISAENYDLGLALYSLFFFVVTYFLSVNPSKIVDWVGKILTPLLLISIAILVVQVFMNPMGEPQQAGGYYASMPYLKGFQEGYYTMDLLATMLFGTVVIDSIKVRGILPIEALSDGARSVISMVADLSYRMVRLNPDLGINAVLKTPGIVLIDEVDMHLHPSWQQTVLYDLRKAFPLVQFIVTTHSPQVLTTVPPQSIRALRWNNDLIDIYQPDFSLGAASYQLLKDIQNVDARPQCVPVVKELKRYLDLVSEDKWDCPEALELRKSLDKWAAGREPALLRADMDIRMRSFRRKQHEKNI